MAALDPLRRRLPPALRHRDYLRLWRGFLTSGFAAQMVAVAVGWQVYAIRRSAFDLGLIGLAEFVPLPLLALPGRPARRPAATRTGVRGVDARRGRGGRGCCSWSRSAARRAVALRRTRRADRRDTGVRQPGGGLARPEIVPGELLAGALALRSVAFQTATVAGPAAGGLLFALRPEAVYVTAIVLFVVASISVLGVTSPATADRSSDPAPRLESLLGGIRLIRATPIILGAITLDLFAVLFGGAVALLPLFARSVLHTGPIGLGILRSTPAIGALVAGVRLARRPLGGRAGRTLLVVVGTFGASMILFGLSHWFWLSALALAVSGFADMISMNIRSTTVALATPNELRGRVNAVESVFISASNELGAFESGAAAALLGAVPAVVGGGAVTVALALAWHRVFPALAKVDRLEDVRPDAPVPGTDL